MEIVVFSLLLLLVCSVSTDPVKKADNKVIGNLPYEPIPDDIHPVLGEMVVSLKVEMKQLQKDNEAQTEKLKELDKQKTELDKLKQQLQARQVAFSAALLAEGWGTFGPFKTFTNLVFKHVVTNIGLAYNSNTGIFTAPVRGAYHFEFYISLPGDNQHGTAAALVKNQDRVFAAFEKQTSHFGSCSNGATLILEVGDCVFVSLWVNAKIFDNQSHHCTFSGHLLFAM